MPYPLFDVFVALPAFALVLFRIAGMAIAAPMFSSLVVPRRVRAAFVMVLAVVIFPLVSRQAPAQVSLTTVLVGGVMEFVIGAVIGLGLTILLMAGDVTGTVVGQQAGLGLSEVINPLQETESSVMGQVYVTVLMLLFLLADGHRAAVAALLDTFKVIPLLSYESGESILLLLVESIVSSFIVGIRVAGPIVIALFLTEAGVGFLSRTVPQLNILSVGFTLRPFIALAVAALSLSASEGILLEAMFDGLDMIRATFGLPSGA